MSLPTLPPSPSLQLGDPEWRRTAEVQEEGPLLLGEEGGGDDVVDAGGDVLHLQVTKAAPTRDGEV